MIGPTTEYFGMPIPIYRGPPPTHLPPESTMIPMALDLQIKNNSMPSMHR